MGFGICNLSVVPVRADAAEQSEMVTQILFGEHFEVLQKNTNWVKVKLANDDYEGWIDIKMFLPIDKIMYDKLSSHTSFVTTEVFSIVYQEDNDAPTFVVTGSSLPFFNKKDKSFSIGSSKWKYYGEIPKHPDNVRDKMIEIALNYRNVPYLWGGRSTQGIDCSGLTQVLYKICGKLIPRDASQQVALGATLNFINEAKPGDLAFFDNEEGEIIHTGVCLKDGKIIHSSGKVRVDILDHQGIYNSETKQYTHKLRVVQNIFE